MSWRLRKEQMKKERAMLVGKLSHPTEGASDDEMAE